ncbi:MAG TPA: hypothetical protein VN442_09895 [Bryobacteraceae bacterium]|nr:hypothetical protein [Bryobacteraceae bacterium]
MNSGISRRQVLATAAAAAAAPAAQTSDLVASVLKHHDQYVDRLLRDQVTDPASRHCGGIADQFGVFQTHGASAVLSLFTASLLHPGSKFYKNPLLVERMRLATRFLEKGQSPEGNISLLTTNFNSPPDTGFVMHGLGTAACIAKRREARELVAMMEPFMLKAGAALTSGGIHTPNHRWVVSSALAQLNEIFPNPAYIRRINMWLAEDVDIDEDGQFTERSTHIYNPICDRAFIVLAEKLKRPELLEPARRNLHSMLYLLHPGFDVVTEISSRRDADTRGNMSGYWFPLRYFAMRDGDGRFAAIERKYAPVYASLPVLMEYPELEKPGPAPVAPPEDYEKQFRALKIAHIRRGLTSATVMMNGRNRFFAVRRGDAIVNAVRFASAFFGKGQFTPQTVEKRGDTYYFSQSLEAGYMQPLDPPQKVTSANWGNLRATRRQTQICKLTQEAWVTETKDGFRLRIKSEGTSNVPLSVEINLGEGGKLEGCEPAPQLADGWILPSGYAVYRTASHAIRFGPGIAEHRWAEVRGSQPKLPGTSVYLTGLTPFDRTIEFTYPA